MKNLLRKLRHLSLRYDILFPLYYRIPIGIAYQLARWQGKFFSRYKQEERHAFFHHMKQTLKLSDTEIHCRINRYFELVELEALDTWFIRHPALHNTQGLINFEHLTTAKAQGRPIILATAHYGRYWLTGSMLSAAGLTTGALTRDDIAENTYNLPEAEFNFRRKKLQIMQSVWQGDFVVESKNIRDLYRALDKDLVVFLFDVPYAEERKTNIRVPFLDQYGTFPTGIYRVAQKKNALIVPFFISNANNTQPNIVFYPALDPQKQSQQVVFSQLASLLETHINQVPEHWWLWPALPHLIDKSYQPENE